MVVNSIKFCLKIKQKLPEKINEGLFNKVWFLDVRVTLR